MANFIKQNLTVFKFSQTYIVKRLARKLGTGSILIKEKHKHLSKMLDRVSKKVWRASAKWKYSLKYISINEAYSLSYILTSPPSFAPQCSEIYYKLVHFDDIFTTKLFNFKRTMCWLWFDTGQNKQLKRHLDSKK